MNAAESAPRSDLRVIVVLPAENAASWQTDLVAAIGAVPGVRCVPLPAAAGGSPSDSAIDDAGEANGMPGAEVVVDLVGIDIEAWRPHAVHGVWQPLDGRGVHLAETTPAYESVSRGVGGELLLVRDGSEVLHTIRFFSDTRHARVLAQLRTKAAILIRNTLQELAALGRCPSGHSFTPLARLSRRQRRHLRLQGHWLAWRRRLASRLLSESWMIGVVDTPIHRLLDASRRLEVRWLGRRERNFYRADPFGLPGHIRKIYCERYCYSKAKGIIELIELNEAGRIGSAAPAQLPVSGHLSYPYLFTCEGRTYGIPESGERRRCELFELKSDGRWQFVATLLEDVAVADASLFVWDGRFWLAYTDNELGPSDNLCLSYAPGLTGPWRRHALHPVKLDHASSRPAGTPFVADDILYRPAQDCRSGYGRAVVINRITLLTPEAFREETVRRFPPDPRSDNPDGLHTLSAWGERTLVDGMKYVLNPIELKRKLWRRLRRSGGDDAL